MFVRACLSSKGGGLASAAGRRGTEEADRRLAVTLTTDSGIGVVRHAQSGYQTAKDVAYGHGKYTDDSIKILLWWQTADQVTFGPEGMYR